MNGPTLHEMIHEVMYRNNPNAAAAWDVVSPIRGITEEANAIQMANRFWRWQLGALAAETMGERSCLVDTLCLADWWSDFTRYVLPTILAAGIPVMPVQSPPPSDPHHFNSTSVPNEQIQGVTVIHGKLHLRKS
jgi:hypothetical protein